MWLWNLEDEAEDIEKTVHAFVKLWNLTPADLGDRLYLDGVESAATNHLKLAVEERGGGAVIQHPASEALIDELKAGRIDYLGIDPSACVHVREGSFTGLTGVVKGGDGKFALICFGGSLQVKIATFLLRAEE